MKRTAVLVSVLVMTATTIVLARSASADVGKVRIYEGTLGVGGLPLKLTLVLREGRPPALSEVEFGADMTCEDGTSQQWSVGLGWEGGPPSLPSHALDLDMVDVSSALHLHGKVQAIHGEGTFAYAIPALTTDEQGQLCTTGELPWTVDRTSPSVDGQSPSPPPPPLQVLRFDSSDGVHVTLTRVR